MAEAITRRVIRESGTDGVSGQFTWLDRTDELAKALYPEDKQGTTWLAAFAMDCILENTLELKEGLRVSARETIPESLLDDQVEDWLTGQAVKQVLAAESTRKLLNG